MDPQAKYFVALSTKKENGARTMAKLLHQYGSAKRAWQKTASAIDPDKELEKVVKLDIDVVTLNDPRYPMLLKEIADPPALLYLRGGLKLEDDIAIAIVGSRSYSDYGRQVAIDFATELAQAGVTVVSGLALGIDGFAHQAALDAAGRTIAVLAHGLDQIYPRSNTSLARQIIREDQGAILSEFPVGTPSYPTNFPIRNRIIAGLALGTLIVEGSQKSGTLLTAQAALDYNRQVYAVPGPIYSQTSAAPNNLLKMGAKPVTSADDILQDLNLESRRLKGKTLAVLPDNPLEQAILAALGKDPVHIDKIAATANLDITKTSSTLIMMEMKGKARNIGGNVYILAR